MKESKVFRRIEKKYILTELQYRILLKEIEGFMKIDNYGESEILNIYYDTPNFYLIRNSLDKPIYKEKLRLRTYGIPNDDAPAFIEIKKKFQDVVYKRRVQMPYILAKSYLNGDIIPDTPLTPVEKQIFNEIEYFRNRYKTLSPQMSVCYKRIAMYGMDDPELRITFDRAINCRIDETDLRKGCYGEQIIRLDQHLMEIKITGAMPLELAHILSKLNIQSTSFSKYGKGYENLILKEEKTPKKIFTHNNIPIFGGHASAAAAY